MLEFDLETSLRLTADHPHFDGHFDGFPLLPGASQVGLVLDMIRTDLGRRVNLRRITRGKFAAPLEPDTGIRIRGQYESDTSCRWEIRSADKLYSSGVLHYG